MLDSLPAAIEESAKEILPQSIKEMAKAVDQSLDIVKYHVGNLPSLHECAKGILDEAEMILHEEKQSDDDLKMQFKQQWNRKPSLTLTEGFTSNISKYRQILSIALDADNVVEEKLEKYRPAIDLLSRSEEEIEKAVLSASHSDISQSSALAKLRLLISDVENFKSERKVLEHELKRVTVDFLHHQAGEVSETEKLEHVCDPIQKLIGQNINIQPLLIEKIQMLNEEFVSEKARVNSLSAREEFLKELTLAYDIYVELQKNLQEGAEFYNDITRRLLDFKKKISKFRSLRKAEKEELIKNLTPPSALPAESSTDLSTVSRNPTFQGRRIKLS